MWDLISNEYLNDVYDSVVSDTVCKPFETGLAKWRHL